MKKIVVFLLFFAFQHLNTGVDSKNATKSKNSQPNILIVSNPDSKVNVYFTPTKKHDNAKAPKNNSTKSTVSSSSQTITSNDGGFTLTQSSSSASVSGKGNISTSSSSGSSSKNGTSQSSSQAYSAIDNGNSYSTSSAQSNATNLNQAIRRPDGRRHGYYRIVWKRRPGFRRRTWRYDPLEYREYQEEYQKDLNEGSIDYSQTNDDGERNKTNSNNNSIHIVKGPKTQNNSDRGTNTANKQPPKQYVKIGSGTHSTNSSTGKNNNTNTNDPSKPVNSNVPNSISSIPKIPIHVTPVVRPTRKPRLIPKIILTSIYDDASSTHNTKSNIATKTDESITNNQNGTHSNKNYPFKKEMFGPYYPNRRHPRIRNRNEVHNYGLEITSQNPNKCECRDRNKKMFENHIYQTLYPIYMPLEEKEYGRNRKIIKQHPLNHPRLDNEASEINNTVNEDEDSSSGTKHYTVKPSSDINETKSENNVPNNSNNEQPQNSGNDQRTSENSDMAGSSGSQPGFDTPNYPNINGGKPNDPYNLPSSRKHSPFVGWARIFFPQGSPKGDFRCFCCSSE